MADSHGHDAGHHGPRISLYLIVFGALCVFTAMSFFINDMVREERLKPEHGLFFILGVAVCKALLVGAFFMHLKWEWGKLYFIIIPVSILGVMMMLVLLPDNVLVWHHEHERDKPSAAETKEHH